jgi:drug/metabolite transporter (DMT)-like permease
VLGVATAVALLGDRLNSAQILGGMIVLLGLLLYPRARVARPASAGNTPAA